MDAHPQASGQRETTCSGARRGAAAGGPPGWGRRAQLGLWEGVEGPLGEGTYSRGEMC